MLTRVRAFSWHWFGLQLGSRTEQTNKQKGDFRLPGVRLPCLPIQASSPPVIFRGVFGSSQATYGVVGDFVVREWSVRRVWGRKRWWDEAWEIPTVVLGSDANLNHCFKTPVKILRVFSSENIALIIIIKESKT